MSFRLVGAQLPVYLLHLKMDVPEFMPLRSYVQLISRGYLCSIASHAL